MKLYYVAPKSFDVDDWSLIVEAETPERAVELWQAYYENEEKGRAWELDPTGTTEGALAWYTPSFMAVIT